MLSLITVSYQLIAIFFVNSLLIYRHYISRVNKLVLLYGSYILIMTHIYRLDEPGKICSGDFLTQAQKDDPMIARNYLLEAGNLFWDYMVGIWVICAGAIIMAIVIGAQVYKTFS